eukprot:scaffold40010_cov58-Phaeocystis_antarctica.AAC.5
MSAQSRAAGGEWVGRCGTTRTTLPTRRATMTAMTAPAAAPASLPSSISMLPEGLPETFASPVDEKPSQMMGWASGSLSPAVLVKERTCRVWGG